MCNNCNICTDATHAGLSRSLSIVSEDIRFGPLDPSIYAGIHSQIHWNQECVLFTTVCDFRNFGNRLHLTTSCHWEVYCLNIELRHFPAPSPHPPLKPASLAWHALTGQLCREWTEHISWSNLPEQISTPLFRSSLGMTGWPMKYIIVFINLEILNGRSQKYLVTLCLLEICNNNRVWDFWVLLKEIIGFELKMPTNYNSWKLLQLFQLLRNCSLSFV